jgi:hypothetical protein
MRVETAMTLLHIIGAMIFISGLVSLGALIWLRESDEPIQPTVPKDRER